MSQPYQSQAPAQPALAPGGPATLWSAPRGFTGLQLRTALSGRLPAGQRLVVIVAAVVVGGAGATAAAALDAPELIPAAAAVAAFVAVLLLRRALTAKRRSHGMVQVTPLQFDLLVALDQLPADRIDAGRQLHDRLIWLLQQPTRDQAAVQQCEHWMWQLATSR